MAFPAGLKMVAGNPYRRSFGGAASDEAISFVCLDYYNDHSGDPEWDQRNGKSFSSQATLLECTSKLTAAITSFVALFALPLIRLLQAQLVSFP
jgi:hypothetical protein